MKKMIATLAGVMVAGSALAADYATVIDVQEINGTRSVPSQQCRIVSVPVYGANSGNGGAIGNIVDGTFGSTDGLVGAIIGGALGNQIGGGSGRDWATAGGAILGSQIANNNRRSRDVVAYQQEQVCETVYTTEPTVIGYITTFEYNGHTFTKREKYRPVVGSQRVVTGVNISVE